MSSVKGGPDLPKRPNRVTVPFEGGPNQPYGVSGGGEGGKPLKRSMCARWYVCNWLCFVEALI